MSTYPIATAHLVGWALASRSDLPWVADFRDPMVEEIDGILYPESRSLRGARLFVERLAAKNAHAVTFCTDSARDIFVDRYPNRPSWQLTYVIPNGFEPDDFSKAEALPPARRAGVIHFVHSGTLYPGPDRDPTTFFRALASMLAESTAARRLRVTLRATGFDSHYRLLVTQFGLQDVVEIAPPLPHHQALRELLDADALLLFQGRPSNPAIPAKAYEYIRAGRPILALIDRDGETARLLTSRAVGFLAQINDLESVRAALSEVLLKVTRSAAVAQQSFPADDLSRVARAIDFAALFDSIERVTKDHSPP